MASLSGALSFLSNGQAPINTMTGSQTSNVLPSWYQDYTQNMLNRGAQYANEPTPVYQGPQVAGLTGDQNQSYQQVRDLSSTYGSVAPNAINTVNSANPQAGLGAASPYLSQADQTSASNVNNYMNPYTQNVVNDIATLGTRNLTENTLPALQAAFTSSGGGGHYGQAAEQGGAGGGNTQEGTLEERLGRDTNTSILQQQNQALQSGYGQALTASATDQARQAALAGTAGNLANTGATNQMTQGIYDSQIGNTGQNMALQQTNALNAAGQQQQNQTQQNYNVGQQNFWQQQQWPLQGLAAEQQALQGVQVPTSQNYQQWAPASTYSPSPLNQLGALASGSTANGSNFGNLGSLLGGLFGNSTGSTTGP